MRQLVDNDWFALADFLLVLISGAIWILAPKLGIWFTMMALLPRGLRILGGRFPFHRTRFDWLIAIFLATAWIGYWAAYDRTAAWDKVWLIVTAVLLYYAVTGQPQQNLSYLSLAAFCFAVGLSIHFFLTYGFTGSRATIAAWWMNHRPELGWPAAAHGYTSGLLLVSGISASHWVGRTIKKSFGNFTVVVRFFLACAAGAVAWVFFLTMSRGIWAIVIGILGTWILWKVVSAGGSAARARMRSMFPALVLAYLIAIIVLVDLGPAKAGGGTPSAYGTNSRAELFERGAYFVRDYPITGGGLSSFPGLYSQYMIVIPYYYFMNSYNLFLDIAIEQGLLGGSIIVFLYFWSLQRASRTIASSQSQTLRNRGWLALVVLMAAIIHGIFYDYLYHGIGTTLLLIPVGISMVAVTSGATTTQLPETWTSLRKASILLMTVLVIGVAAMSVLNTNKLTSIWYSNLGAVQMSQVELREFPTNQWMGSEIVSRLGPAEASLRTAVEYDAGNQTANYRLGMISMSRQDFEAALSYLERAHEEAPRHRGVTKSLGYCYVWLGNLERAQILLDQVPEAKDELNVYVWWWDTQGRNDLSEKASLMLARLESSSE